MDNVRNGMFMAANKLYGVTFEKRTDLPVYYEGVETFEVKEQDGSHVGILYLDYFPRDSKGGGAWCTGFREGGYNIKGEQVTYFPSTLHESVTRFHQYFDNLEQSLDEQCLSEDDRVWFMGQVR